MKPKMKGNKMKKTKVKLMTAAVLVIAILTAASSYGMNLGTDEKQLTEKQANIIVMGILSVNSGVSQCCIYYSGKYKINQSVDVLVDILNDTSSETYKRILAAVSLGRIRNNKGIKAIKDIAGGEKDGQLKMVCDLIYKELFELNQSNLSAQN